MIWMGHGMLEIGKMKPERMMDGSMVVRATSYINAQKE